MTDFNLLPPPLCTVRIPGGGGQSDVTPVWLHFPAGLVKSPANGLIRLPEGWWQTGETIVEFMAVKVIGAFLPLREYPDVTVSQGCGAEVAGSGAFAAWVRIMP